MEMKLKSKKGMFLTFISITLITAAIIVFTPSDINLKKELPIVQTRVESVNNYILDLQNVYIERTIYSAGIKTLTALTEYVGVNGGFADEDTFNDAFIQVFHNGELGGSSINPGIMDGNSFSERLDDIKIASFSTYGIATQFWYVSDITHEIKHIRIFQDDPSTVIEELNPWTVIIEVDINISGISETASWIKNVTVRSEIEVEGFIDPYILAKSNGQYRRSINRTNTKFNEWDIGKVNDMIDGGNYTHWDKDSSNAPSYLGRFLSDPPPSDCCGIESFVDPRHASITPKDVSYLDYYYFRPAENCNSPTYTIYSISGTVGTHFNLDSTSIGNYKLTSSATQECPPP